MNTVRIPEFDGYELSEDGTVISLKSKPLVLKTNISNSGYKYVRLHKSGYTDVKYIHRLLAENFIPNINRKTDVNHKDGNKLNNSLDNLEWSTKKENTQHAEFFNLMNHGLGEKSPNNKLKEDEVLAIREYLNRGRTIKMIAKEFDVAPTTISKIKNNKTWRWLK